MKPHALTATEAIAMMKNGELTVEEMAKSCLARIAERDPDVEAWAFLDPELVLESARALDRAETQGPLHGIPVGIKDMIYTADMPTRHNSPIYEHDETRYDAAAVKTLRASGALIFGKTTTTEFASTMRGGKTRNPFDPARSPGGSSSGSAAAVGDSQVTLAMGTQTGGSTIRPASFCGAFALKPTWNAISREGAKIFSLTCDTIGLYARSVADLDLLAEVYNLDGELLAPGAGLSDMRIAYCRTPNWDKAEPATRDALDLGIALLREAGAEVDELVLPPLYDDIHENLWLLMRHEGRAAFRGDYLATPDLLHEEFRAMVENRNGVTPSEVRAAYDAAGRYRAGLDELIAGYDAILTPSAPGEAIPGRDAGDNVFNGLWTFMHAPVVNIPGFRGPNGMPVGLSLVGQRFTDRHLLGVASRVADLFAARGSWARPAATAA